MYSQQSKDDSVIDPRNATEACARPDWKLNRDRTELTTTHHHVWSENVNFTKI